VGAGRHPYGEIIATGISTDPLDMVMMLMGNNNGLDGVRLHPNLPEA
jgi:hypothetical protein